MAITALTLTLRKSGVSAGNTISINSSSTGQFEDVTPHTDSFVASDEINYKVVTFGTAGSLTYNHVGVLITNTESSTFIKTIDGLAKASVKIVNGLTLALMKTWNGLT